MTVGNNLEKFAGLKVVEFEAGEPLPNPATHAPRISIRYEGAFKSFAEAWGQFMATPGVEKITALVIGNWADPGDGPVPSEEALETIVADASKFPHLKALFFGDITSEENEISWIEHGDVSAIWGAFPLLEEFGIRGSNGLNVGRIKHAKLKKLVIQSGGLPTPVLHAAIEADLPNLEHFEVWLGTENYGGNSRPEDVAPLLSGAKFPKLKTLALRNCEWADDLAIAVSKAPILSRIKILDLSMGTIGDAGVGSLAATPGVAKLVEINISHHYASDAMVARLKAQGVAVNAADKQEPDTYGGEENRYVAVSE